MIALAASGNSTSIGSISLSSLSSDALLFFAIIIGSAIFGIIADVLITAYINNSLKNNAATAIDAMVNVTNAAITANQNTASQAINALLLLAGINDVQHMLDKKMIRELNSLSSSGSMSVNSESKSESTSQHKPEENKEIQKSEPISESKPEQPKSEENKEMPKHESISESKSDQPKPEEKVEEKK